MGNLDLLLRLSGRIVKGCRPLGSVALARCGPAVRWPWWPRPAILEHMFDLVSLAGVDSRDDEASLTARIAELERVKSAAAAGQARAAAALDKLRRCNEADAGVPARRRGRGV
ncbi:HNH endonuclease, partial [Mycobacterium tuberculosis]